MRKHQGSILLLPRSRRMSPDVRSGWAFRESTHLRGCRSSEAVEVRSVSHYKAQPDCTRRFPRAPFRGRYEGYETIRCRRSVSSFGAGQRIADHVLDVSFDWSVRYSAMSPAKLSLAQSKIMSTGVWGKMSDDSYSARNRDEEDLISEPLSG